MAHERNASPMVLKRQLDFMASVDCDVWLLAEVPYTFNTVSEPGSTALSESMDRTHKVYAAVWAKDGLTKEREVHEAAALATVGGLRVCSCLLPSNETAFKDWPDRGFDRPSVLRKTVDRLHAALGAGSGGLVLGGSWSQAFEGEDEVGTDDGRESIGELLATLDLQLATAALPRARDGEGSSTDHIAVPRAWNVISASRVVAAEIGGHPRSGDHDAYIAEVEP